MPWKANSYIWLYYFYLAKTRYFLFLNAGGAFVMRIVVTSSERNRRYMRNLSKVSVLLCLGRSSDQERNQLTRAFPLFVFDFAEYSV